MQSEQLSLFTLAPASQIKTIHDPYWDELEIAPQPKPLAVGDSVKLSVDWMNNCVKVAGSQFKKDYCYQSEDDLQCIVKWVDPVNGNIYVDRGGNALYVPSGYFEIAEADSRGTVDQNSASTFRSVELSGDLGQLVVPSHFIEESVREQDTQGVRKDPEFTTAQVAPEHLNSAPEHIHWIENYWVKRGNKKHHYYRYCWMTGRKINRIHIGSLTSAIALSKKQSVEIAISDGQSPSEIEQLIRQQPSF